MTTKSPASTWGANWGLCLPRRRIAVWLASRPSTTSVASMTCQARVISPGFGVYVRTRLTVHSSSGGRLVVSPHRARETWPCPDRSGARTRVHQPAARAERKRYQPAGRSPPGRRSADLAQPPGADVVDGAPDLGAEQVGR